MPLLQLNGGIVDGQLMLSAGFILLAALFAGNLFKRVGLPQLSGYILLGLLAGPCTLGLLSQDAITNLQVVNGAAIALIALTAGAELDVQKTRPLLRAIGWITVIGVIGTMAVLAMVTFLIRDLLSFTAGLGVQQMIAIAAVLGVTISAQSPAVVIALRKELQASGPLTRTVLGVVVVSDLVIILLFALTSTFARPLLAGGKVGFELITVAVLQIGTSLAAGVVVAAGIAILLRFAPSAAPVLLLLVCFAVAETARHLHLDLLLIVLIAGLIISNGTAYAERLQEAVDAVSGPVYVLFFAIVGATVDVSALIRVAGPASVLVIARCAGFLGGSALGACVAGSTRNVRRFAGFGLLPQAGLALALALLFARNFPELGPEASALVFAIVGINEVLAPVAYKWALVKSGEATVGDIRATRAAPETFSTLPHPENVDCCTEPGH